MASMTFRFTTECEMTLTAESYEEAYLRFKDFMHGHQVHDQISALTVLPPASVQIFFNTDRNTGLHEIGEFKGDFREDIVTRCGAAELAGASGMPHPWQFRQISLDCIPEVYW